MLHFHGDLLDAALGVIAVGCRGGGGGAGVAVLPYPPCGRAEGDEEEDAADMNLLADHAIGLIEDVFIPCTGMAPSLQVLF